MKAAAGKIVRQAGRRALSGHMTPQEKVMFKTGPTNAYPGNKYLLNVPNPEEPVPDAIAGENQRAWASGHKADPAIQGDSDIAKDVQALRRSPPMIYTDHCSNAFNTGNLWSLAGGSLDPYLKFDYILNHGIGLVHASYFNESAAGLVNLAFDSGKIEQGSMYQSLTNNSGKATRYIQAQFTTERADQGFTQLPVVANGEESVDPTQGGKLREEVNWHFGAVGAAFVTQGSLGSTNDDEVRVEVMSDTPAHALFWNKVLHELPSRSTWSMNTFSPPIRLYHASCYQFENMRVIEEYGGPKPKDFGLEHNQFVYVDPYSKPAAALIAGDISLETGRNILAYLSAVVMHEELEVAVVPGDATVDPKTGDVTVYVTDDAATTQKVRADENLFGAHQLTFSPDGVGRLWDGVTRNIAKTDAPGEHNLVTTEDNGKTHQLTQSLNKRLGDPTSARKNRNYHADFATNLSESKRYASVDEMAGMTLGKAKASATAVPRPNLVPYSQVKLVFVKDGAKAGALSADAAASELVAAIKAWGFPYASDADLKTSLQNAFDAGLTASVQAPAGQAEPAAKATPAASTKKGKKK